MVEPPIHAEAARIELLLDPLDGLEALLHALSANHKDVDVLTRLAAVAVIEPVQASQDTAARDAPLDVVRVAEHKVAPQIEVKQPVQVGFECTIIV